MFHENYAFFSSTSARMATHFKQLADLLMEDYLKSPNPFVVEIGSNDGIMLQHFANAGFRHLGIEPSRNVAQEAINKGIQTVCRFFDESVAQEILAEHGQADVFLGANVVYRFCTIFDYSSFIEGLFIFLGICSLFVILLNSFY